MEPLREEGAKATEPPVSRPFAIEQLSSKLVSFDNPATTDQQAVFVMRHCSVRRPLAGVIAHLAFGGAHG